MYSQFGLNVSALCCGDEALARMLKSKGVSLKGYWPMFNGEAPDTVAFGREMWCEPVVFYIISLRRIWRGCGSGSKSGKSGR